MKNILFTLALLISFVSFGQTAGGTILEFGGGPQAEEYSKKSEKKSANKDYYGAIADLTKAAELGMNFAYFKRGVEKIYLNDDDGALKDFTIYIDNGGKYFWAFRSRASIYYDKDMFQEALEDYLTSINIDPNETFESHPYYSIGHCRSALGDMDGACEDWKKASEKGNKFAANDILKYCNFSQDYFKSGLEKYENGDLLGAIADYTKAIEINPNIDLAYFNRGFSKYDLKDYKGAISDYTKAIALDPNNAFAYSNRGLAKYDLKDYKGAISDYTKAIEIDPNYAYAYSNRGLAKDDLKDYKGAIEDFTKAIEINPNYSNAYKNRGASKDNLGDLSGACADWRKAANLGDTDAAEWVKNQCN